MVFEVIEARLELAAQGFQAKIGDAVQSLGMLEGKAGGAHKAVGALGVGMAAVAAGGIAKSVSASMDLQSALTESQAIMGDLTQGEMKAMENAAREVGKTTTFSASEAGEAFYFLASAGMDAEQSVASMADVAQFAQAGAFDLATATDLATDAQSALGLSSEDAAENAQNLNRVMDVLVKSNTLANASVEEFSQSLTNKAAAAMRQVGMEVEEGASALAVFADQGLKGQRAGTILARTIEGLQQSAQENAEAFQELGIAVYDADGNMRPMADIVGDMDNAFAGMSTEQKNAAMAQLGLNERAAQGINLMSGNTDQMREYESELKNAGGTSEEVANNQLKSLSAQWEILKSQITDIGIGIGNVLLPPLTLLLEHVSVAVGWFSQLNDQTSGMAGTVALLGTLFTGLAMAAGSLAAVVGAGGLTTAVTAATGAVGGLGTALTLLTGPVGIAIALVAGLAYAYKTNLWGMRDVTNSVIGRIREVIGGAFTWLKTNVIAPFLAWFGPIWNQKLALVREEWALTVGALREDIAAFIEWARPYVNAFLAALSQWWGKHGDEVMLIVTTLTNALKRIFGDTFSIIIDLLVGFIRVARGDFSGFKDSMLSIVDTLVNGVVDLFWWLYDKLVGNSIIPDMLAAMVSAWLNFHKEILGAIGQFAGDVVSDFRQLATDAVGALLDKVSDFRDAGKAMITAVGDGIANNISSVKSKVKNAAQTVRDYWPSSPAKYGPLSDIDRIGPGLIDEIIKGIRNNTGRLASAAGSAAGAARESLDALQKKHGEWSGEAVNEALRSLTDAEVSGLAESMEHSGYMWEQSANAARKAIEDVRSGSFVGQELYDELGGGQAFGFLKNALNTSNPRGKVLAEDGSYVDPSFYSGGQNQAQGSGGDTIIDFSGIPDDAWIRIGDLKEAIQRDQRTAARSSTTKPY